MFKLFVPRLYIQDFTCLNLRDLEIDKGIKVLVLDIDNTLVPFDIALPTEEVKEFFNSLLSGNIKPVVISNNHEERVKIFLEGFDIPYYYSAKKPLKFAYKKLLKDLKVKKEEVATIGDQLMTDVFGANRMGFYTILTRPLVKRDGWTTRINRVLEKIMFFILRKKGLFDHNIL